MAWLAVCDQKKRKKILKLFTQDILHCIEAICFRPNHKRNIHHTHTYIPCVTKCEYVHSVFTCFRVTISSHFNYKMICFAQPRRVCNVHIVATLGKICLPERKLAREKRQQRDTESIANMKHTVKYVFDHGLEKFGAFSVNASIQSDPMLRVTKTQKRGKPNLCVLCARKMVISWEQVGIVCVPHSLSAKII